MMKRVVVMLSVVLVLCCALTSTAGAHCVWISHQNAKLLVQEVYAWELTKSCDIVEPVSLPVGDSVDVHYSVTAVRSKPQTIRTVELSAKVTGVSAATVIYNGEKHAVDVVDGGIGIELPYVCGASSFSVKAGCLTRKFCMRSLQTVKKGSINAAATLRDEFDSAPEGLSITLPEGFPSLRELKDCRKNTYLFEYTVTVQNRSSYDGRHTLNNAATLELPGGEPLRESASFLLTTPEKPVVPEPVVPEPGEPGPGKPEPKQDPGPGGKEQKPEAKPAARQPLPRTGGGLGLALVMGGTLMMGAGVLLRRFR